MSVIKITAENYDSEVKNSKKPVMLDFWAEWCGPCRMVSPIIDEIAEENDDIKVGKVNVDEQPLLHVQNSCNTHGDRHKKRRDRSHLRRL